MATSIVAEKDAFPHECLRVSLVALFRVVNTHLYNTDFESSTAKSSSSVGLLASPSKLRNLETQMKEVVESYREFFSEQTLAELISLLVR